MRLYDLYWFIGIFLTVYLFYLFFSIFRKKKDNYDKDNYNNYPIELKLLLKKYRLDMKKIEYRFIMNFISLVSAFDIAFTVTFVCHYLKNDYLRIIIGGCMLIPIILITFNFIGLYYKKKGCVINGNKKN